MIAYFALFLPVLLAVVVGVCMRDVSTVLSRDGVVLLFEFVTLVAALISFAAAVCANELAMQSQTNFASYGTKSLVVYSSFFWVYSFVRSSSKIWNKKPLMSERKLEMLERLFCVAHMVFSIVGFVYWNGRHSSCTVSGVGVVGVDGCWCLVVLLLGVVVGGVCVW